MKCGDIRCRVCGKNALETGGWLKRVNELGVTGIWECRPHCFSNLTPDERLLAALEDSPIGKINPP